jgi:hypothetical protein
MTIGKDKAFSPAYSNPGLTLMDRDRLVLLFHAQSTASSRGESVERIISKEYSIEF